MKLSERTLSILQHFSFINKSIMFQKGNIIKTKPEVGDSPTVQVYIEEEIPISFALYDLKMFLQILKTFNEPNIEFEESYMTISSGKKKSIIRYSSQNYISSPSYDKTFKLPSVDCEFNLQYDDIESIIKSAKIIGYDQISFSSNGNKLHFGTFGKKNYDSYQIEIQDDHRKYDMIFNINDFNLFKTDVYKFKLCFKGIIQVESSNSEIIYWIAASNKSKYS